jgi:hypothetical protein
MVDGSAGEGWAGYFSQKLTGKRLLVPYKAFPTPARRKDAPPEIPVVPWEDLRPAGSVSKASSDRLISSDADCFG